MKYIYIILVSLFSISCNSQIVNIKDWRGDITNGAYYKDVDNELNQFVGTYKLVSNNGNDEMTIVFKKIYNFTLPNTYYEDLLVGEMKFKKDGVLYFDNLSKINENYTNKYRHDIAGNTLIANQTRPTCDDCWPNQFRARLIFFGRDNNCGGNIILQKINENGQEKIRASFWFDCGSIEAGQTEAPVSYILGGVYLLIKQ